MALALRERDADAAQFASAAADHLRRQMCAAHTAWEDASEEEEDPKQETLEAEREAPLAVCEPRWPERPPSPTQEEEERDWQNLELRALMVCSSLENEEIQSLVRDSVRLSNQRESRGSESSVDELQVLSELRGIGHDGYRVMTYSEWCAWLHGPRWSPVMGNRH